MPFYKYQCDNCGNKFSKLVKMSERNNIRECPECGQKSAKKVITSFNMGNKPTLDFGPTSMGKG